jgi:hypothetical protein
MKWFLGLSLLILGLSLPAHAQRSQFGGGGSTGGVANSVGGGASGGAGKPTFPSLYDYPRTIFGSIAVTGDGDFVPSSFVPFQQAVKEGQSALAAEHTTVAEAARANSIAPKEKARIALVEDAAGNPVIATIVYEN